MKKVIITAACHPVLPQSLLHAGFEVINAADFDEVELRQVIGDAEGLVVTTRIKVGATLLNAAANLKWIGRLGSGLELIDLPYAKSKGIVCYSTPEGNATAVGEHALMLLLSGMRHLIKANKEVKNAEWIRSANRGTEVHGKTLGIIGYGHTGAAFAKAASGLGMRIMAYDKYKFGFSIPGLAEVTQQAIQEEADFISFHVPHSSENLHICDEDFLNQLKRKPFIINTSRGSVIHQAHLLAALRSEQVCGAALDVLENEKLDNFSEQESEIFKALNLLPQVTITPHIAGYTHEAYYKMSAFLLQKLGIVVQSNR